VNDNIPETSPSPSDAGDGPVVGEAQFYINEDDPPRRWWRVPAGAGPEWYLRRARSWALASAILFVGHLALYILELVG
jgi:hypothetical protein